MAKIILLLEPQEDNLSSFFILAMLFFSIALELFFVIELLNSVTALKNVVNVGLDVMRDLTVNTNQNQVRLDVIDSRLDYFSSNMPYVYLAGILLVSASVIALYYGV